MSELLDYLVSKVESSTVSTNPWPHIKISNFLPNSEYHNLLDQHNEVDWSECWDPESSWRSCVLDHAYTSRKLFNAICNKFNMGVLNYDANQKFKLDTPEHKLQFPHRDKDLSLMTMQIFLQPRCYTDGGTVLMADEDSIIEELPLEANYCSIFLNTKYSWHMVKQRGYIRKSMVQRWTKI
jgi:hypothetical protein